MLNIEMRMPRTSSKVCNSRWTIWLGKKGAFVQISRKNSISQNFRQLLHFKIESTEFHLQIKSTKFLLHNFRIRITIFIAFFFFSKWIEIHFYVLFVKCDGKLVQWNTWTNFQTITKFVGHGKLKNSPFNRWQHSNWVCRNFCCSLKLSQS